MLLSSADVSSSNVIYYLLVFPVIKVTIMQYPGVDMYKEKYIQENL